MSGHSKFHNIKATKDKADKARSNIFTKIGRELAVAVKAGGADPSTNSKLYDVIQKAKQNNMPNDTIQRSIKKASGATDTDNFEAITYEGYGPHGVAFIVECLTDNRNRTASDVRHLFDKHGGSLGTSGSVMYMFDRKGVIMLEPKAGASEDDVMMAAIEAGADDVITEEDGFVIYTSPEAFHAVSKAFEDAGFNVISSEVEYISSNLIPLDESQAESIEKLKDKLEELDDVQEVYTNLQ